ncbi:hypothetical protein ACFFP0_12675 [Rhizobium puerariae]|uniref:Uncharacterized protein n=1 Tax=Rhizobium puerariae TaxID=1585791 RepID=A0ABV6AGF8_9HYPH
MGALLRSKPDIPVMHLLAAGYWLRPAVFISPGGSIAALSCACPFEPLTINGFPPAHFLKNFRKFGKIPICYYRFQPVLCLSTGHGAGE